MNTDGQRAMLHYRRALVDKRRGVDKKGLMLALIFLIAISLWAGWRSERTTEQVIAWHEQPNLSAEIEIRPVAKSAFQGETAQLGQSLAGLTGTLHDPRQER
jgi:hypothetical protein